MPEHTPGPWRLDEAQREVLALKIKRICEVPGNGVISTGVDKANAHLIAAAPLLLDALEILLGVGGHYDACFGGAPYYRVCEPICAQARAAVLAARGEASR